MKKQMRLLSILVGTASIGLLSMSSGAEAAGYPPGPEDNELSIVKHACNLDIDGQPNSASITYQFSTVEDGFTLRIHSGSSGSGTVLKTIDLHHGGDNGPDGSVYNWVPGSAWNGTGPITVTLTRGDTYLEAVSPTCSHITLPSARPGGSGSNGTGSNANGTGSNSNGTGSNSNTSGAVKNPTVLPSTGLKTWTTGVASALMLVGVGLSTVARRRTAPAEG